MSEHRFSSVTARAHLVALLLVLSSLTAAAQGPVGSWPFTGNANDVSGGGTHGTVFGATLTPDRFGIANRAYQFDGISNYIRIGPHTIFEPGNGEPFSIGVWVKFCTPQARMQLPNTYAVGIVGTLGITGAAYTNRTWVYWGFVVWSSGADVNVPGFYGQGTPRFEWLARGLRIDDGRWHHMVMTTERDVFDAGTGRWSMLCRWYVDGAQMGSQSGWNYDFSASGGSPFYVGRDDLSNPLYFKGAIDDVAIYDRTLTANEVFSLYSEGGWPLSTGLTITPGATQRICDGDSVRITANGTGPIAYYRWSPTNGLSDTASRATTARPQATTTYRVDAYSGEPCGQLLASQSVTIEVEPKPRMGVNGQTHYVCRGDTLVLGRNINGSAGPYRISWLPSTGLSSTTSFEPRLAVESTERYIATITSVNGCIGRDTVYVSALPRPIAVAGPDTLYCIGATGIALGTAADAVGGNAPYRYAWSPLSGLDDSTLKRPVARPAVTTQYTLVVTDAAGCKGYDTVVVRAAGAPAADAGDDADLCTGGSIVIGSTAVAGHRYRWSPAAGLSDANAAMPAATPSSSTTYHLTVTNAAGCEARDSVRVTVFNPVPTASTSKLDFGTLDGCTSSSQLDLTLSNTGTTPLRITAANIATANFIALATLPIDIAAGASTTLRVRFAPSSAGIVRDTLVLRGEPCSVVARVALEGSREESLLSASTPLIDFGRMLACEARDSVYDITITNGGDAVATLRDARVDAPYLIEPSQPLPASISARGTFVIRVRYRPIAAGVHASELRIPFESGSCRDTLRVRLSGVVEQPMLASLAAIDFGTLDGCDVARDTTLELRNDGVTTISVVEAVAPAGYRVLTALPLSVEGGSFAQLALRYEPASSGSSGGDLVLAYGPCEMTMRIALNGIKRGISFAVEDTVDFGSIVDCDGTGSDASQTLTLAYAGTAGSTATVRSVTASGPFTTNLATGTSIATGASASFDVRFVPASTGTSTGFIELVLEPCGITRRIELTGSLSRMTLASTDVDYGVRSPGTAVTRQVVIVNTGAASVTIDSIAGIRAPFTVRSMAPSLPALIAPGDSLTVDIELVAVDGVSLDTLFAYSSGPCVLEHPTPLRGEGVSTSEATIALSRVVAAAGDRVHVALILDSARGLEAANAHAFEAIVAFDRSMLVPVDKNGVTADASTRRVVITGVRGASDTLASREMIATLGLAETTPLRLESFTWTDATASVATTLHDGELRVTGICPSGGTRLFDGSGVVVLKAPAPNPSTGTAAIEYQLNETGRTQLVLHDATGSAVATLVDDVMTDGVYAHWIDVTSLPAGSYMVVLTTRTLVLSERMEVRN